MGIQMKNPGAVSDATGAAFKSGNFRNINTAADIEAMQKRHDSACRMLQSTLAIYTPEVWVEFANIAFIRLNEHERVMLAFHVMRTLKPRNRQRVFEAAQWGLHHEA